ncbi:hypothetical protein TIFTF001_045533 [Ficus carica]|uniref:Uncharacterized protein n=1 Tax=Ficus carica TaxID=3494 RepID=A0AA87YRM6_FICCA|nr:hypothetical protein TIFTF001_045533 [Ficus carica]
MSELHRLNVIVLADNRVFDNIPSLLLKLRRLYVLELHNNSWKGRSLPLNQTTSKLKIFATIFAVIECDFSGISDVEKVLESNQTGQDNRRNTRRHGVKDSYGWSAKARAKDRSSSQDYEVDLATPATHLTDRQLTRERGKIECLKREK